MNINFYGTVVHRSTPSITYELTHYLEGGVGLLLARAERFEGCGVAAGLRVALARHALADLRLQGEKNVEERKAKIKK